MTPGHCSRAVRAAMFAALCVLLAGTAHVLMSGKSVPGWAMAAALAGTAALAWSLARAERGPLAVTTVAVAVQAALHAGFSLVQSLSQPLPSGRSFAQQWAQYLTCGDTDLSPSEAARVVSDAGLGGMVHQPPPARRWRTRAFTPTTPCTAWRTRRRALPCRTRTPWPACLCHRPAC